MTTATPRVEYSDAISTGDRPTDIQHKYLISLVNEIADMIDNHTAETELGRLLPLLRYYCEWHFEREELCMARRICPLAEANEKAHKTFIRTVEEYSARYRAEGASHEMAVDMYQRLTDWLVSHILKVDATMRDHPDVENPQRNYPGP